MAVYFDGENKCLHPREYDLHVAFGNAKLTQISLEMLATLQTGDPYLHISHLTISGHLEDLYDFDHERGGLNSEGAVLQIGWDSDMPTRDAGHIFFDHVDFEAERYDFIQYNLLEGMI
ncbi:MAG: hypothetical protein ILO10_00605 [Kiritimatiellae bacterium]|nr:hypothetical protein [Kiritimatiellia bacterium]